MTEPTLEGCREKWARGAALLGHLKERVEEYKTEEPAAQSVRGGFVPQLKSLVVRGKVERPNEDALMWGVLLGDALHNLRSALDHLVWQLIRLDSGKDGTTDSQFPISSTGAGYWSITKKGAPSTRDRMLRGVNDDAPGDHRRRAALPPQPGGPDAGARSTARPIELRQAPTNPRGARGTRFGPDDPLPFEANEDAGEPEGPPKLAPFVESEEVDVFVQEYTCPGPNPDVRITGPLVVGIGFGDEALDMPLRVRALAAMEQEVSQADRRLR